MHTDLLIVAAHEPELGPLRRRLSESPVTPQHIVLQAVGVGVVQAAIGTAQALMAYEPEAVLLVGSCGVFPGRAQSILQCVLPTRFELVDPGVMNDTTTIPPLVPSIGSTDDKMLRALQKATRLGSVHAATTLGITTSDVLASQIAERTNCDVENMEGLAVARACHEMRIPFAALLCITNHVGSTGRMEFREHASQAAQLSAEVAMQWIRG